MPVEERASPAPVLPSAPRTIRQAAADLGLTMRGVRQAIYRGRLAATWSPAGYLIARQAIVAYRHRSASAPSLVALLAGLVGQTIELALGDRPSRPYRITSLFHVRTLVEPVPALADTHYCLALSDPAAPQARPLLVPLQGAVWEPVAALLWPDPRPHIRKDGS